MTRAKEITKEAKKFAKEIDDWEIAEDVQDAFEQGALWADRTMIEKACEWLSENPPMRFDDVQNYVEQFKQAMKEE